MPVPLSTEKLAGLPGLNLPEYDIKLRCDESGNAEIYDCFRKRYISLTPEEWVRQNFALYLVKHQGFPQSRIKLEKYLKIAGNSRRCDIVYFDKSLNPEIIVECKSADIKISHKTFNQIALYNSALKVKYLIVTNGITHYVAQIDYENHKYDFLNYIPEYKK